MKFNTYLTENFNFLQYIDKLKKLGLKKADKLLRDSFDSLVKLFIDNGVEKEALQVINKHLKKRFKSFKEIKREYNKSLSESYYVINEDLKHFWELIWDQAWGGAVFYPMLQLFFELDKLIADKPVDIKRILVYGTIFLFLLSTQHVKLYLKWKKEHPEEFEKEGKPKVFGI